MKSFADQVSNFIPNHFVSLGTDGYGRSDSREALIRFFELDPYYIVIAAIQALSDQNKFYVSMVADAI